MPFNGSGVFQRVRNWVADATAGIKIRADYHDAEDDGFAAGLTNCITKDGQTIVTQNIPFNSKRVTGLADPINPQDAATKAYTDTTAVAGGTFTGDITIKKNLPTLTLDGQDAEGLQIIGQKTEKQRWLLRPGNDTAETGSNVGTDFDILRYADDGTYLGMCLTFTRSTGLGTVAGDPTTAYGISTKNYTDVRDNALQANINNMQPNLGFTPVQQGGGTGMATNKVYLGWDGVGLRHQIDNNDTFMYLPRCPSPTIPGNTINDGRFAYAGDVALATGPQNTTYEPYGGAAITGWIWILFSGIPIPSNYRLRYLQLHSTSWYTVGYA